ncbi:MAG: type III-A CRISPR-associated RAMP protein Csm5 [Magnetococcales bacterium]|nr:type III-A CRISPR-associated RAMP protein Csm5 [Magnetococcales bacterium]
MIRFLDSRPLLISTLGPVHVGCGVDYEPTGYVMEERIVHTFDPVEALRDNAPAREKLSHLCAGSGEEVIQKVQEFFYEKRDELIPFSTHSLTASEQLQKFYDERVKPERRMGKANKLYIERTAYVATENRPILPGSSLKGAIRTALLNREHDGKKLVDPGAAERKDDWKKIVPLNQTLKNCLPGDFARDPMRLIRVGDAGATERWTGNDLRFAVNRTRSGKAAKGPYQVLECLPPMELELFSGTLSFLDPGSASNVAENRDDLPANIWNSKDVTRSCNQFYEKRLRQELDELQAFMPQQFRKIMIQSLEGGGLRRLLDSGRAFLLRVGRHCGAESVTLEGVRHIKQPQWKKWVERPDTVWLAAKGQETMDDLLPFGWLLVEWNDSRRKPLTETALELVGMSEGGSKTRKKLRAAAEEKKKKLREKNEVERLQREKVRQERERLALAEEEKKKRLQSLSENERLIEQLRQRLEKTRVPQPIGGDLWQEVQALVKKIEGARQEWQAHEIAALALLCREELPTRLKGGQKKLKELEERLNRLQGEKP